VGDGIVIGSMSRAQTVFAAGYVAYGSEQTKPESGGGCRAHEGAPDTGMASGAPLRKPSAGAR
jgi:hypothetical protein